MIVNYKKSANKYVNKQVKSGLPHHCIGERKVEKYTPLPLKINKINEFMIPYPKI